MPIKIRAKQFQRIGALLKSGLNGSQVARALGVSRQTIARLRHDPRLYNGDLARRSRFNGRPAAMTAQQQNDARLVLLRTFSLAEHGIARAARIIKDLTGVDYSHRHVYRLLKKLKAELPKGVLFGHYNHTKHRCNTCGAMLVKRECLLCMLRDMKGTD